MKLLITYGQSKDNAGTRICTDWDSKKKGDEYTELSELAGRQITDRDVKFVDISKHARNERVHNFFKEYTLEKLIQAYEKHLKSTRMPADYQEAIKEYVGLWLQYKEHFAEWDRKKGDAENLPEFEELRRKAAELSGKYSRFRKKEPRPDLLFPAELQDFISYGRTDILKAVADLDELEAITGQVGQGASAIEPNVEEQLKKEAASNIAVMDFQCSPGGLFSHPGKLYGYNRICIPSQPAKGVPWYKMPVFWARQSGRKNDLYRRLDKYANTALAVERGDGLRCAFPYLSIEIWPKMDEKKGKDMYKDFCKYPTFHFLSLLNRMFTERDPFSSILKFCYELGRVKDAGFYKTPEFHAAKKFVANTIREILEWGEKHESKAR